MHPHLFQLVGFFILALSEWEILENLITISVAIISIADQSIYQQPLSDKTMNFENDGTIMFATNLKTSSTPQRGAKSKSSNKTQETMKTAQVSVAVKFELKGIPVVIFN